MMMYHIDMDSSISFWINPVILVAIGTMLWRSQVRRFDQIDKRLEQINAQFRDMRKQLRDLTREVAANGRSIARIEGRHEGHHRDMATVE